MSDDAIILSHGEACPLKGIDTDISRFKVKRDGSRPCHEIHYLDVMENLRTYETFSCVGSNFNVVAFGSMAA